METRRDFIKKSALGAAGLAVGFSAKSYGRIIGANDRVRVGLVGFADRTRQSLLPAFWDHSQALNYEVVALSDIWNRRRDEGLAFVKQKTGQTIKLARNNDELYDMKEVDAVIIATADFQHAQHCIEAVKAGRHAYVEKPFANNMNDAREALRVVTASNRVVQVGTQRRSAPNYHAANEFIRSGKFGDINMVEMTWNVNQPGRWRRPQLVASIQEKDTDWKRFLLNRPYEAWDPRKYLEYRLFWPYSSGIPCQWMVHQIDTVHWFTGYERPRSVVANGGIYQWHDGRSSYDTMTAVFDYGTPDLKKGFQVVYSSRMGNAAGGTKELYYSNGGTLNLDTNQITPEGGLTKDMASAMGMSENLLTPSSIQGVKMETGANTGGDIATSQNMRNWMECVRSGKQPNAPIQAGYQHSVALCMVIAALQSGKRVTFSDERQDVVIG
jgi:predicted dehydrogenase